MNYTFHSATLKNRQTDCLILPVWEDAEATVSDELDTHLQDILQQLRASGDLTGKSDTTLFLPVENSKIRRLLLIGSGKPDKFNRIALKKFVQTAASVLKTSACTNATLCFEFPLQSGLREALQQAVIAFDECFYRFDQFKSNPAPSTKLKDCQWFISKNKLAKIEGEQAVSHASAIAKGVRTAKDLGNLPSNICTPAYLAEESQKLAVKYKKLTVDILDQDEMKKLGMGALLSVAKGSVEPPKLIILHYQGATKNTENHLLVGKGITFDSGGISLKPGAQMDEMKYDMCGAASVLGTMTALCEIKPKLNIVAIIASAENMPAGNASKPGDIVTTMDGKTVEILNTDAEGRLVLCDALTYAKRFKPASIVDIATLTGACILALGHEVSGLLSNDDDMATELIKAGQQLNDRAWQLPLWEEYQSQLDSNFADMQNIGGRPAGTITAACFLSRFTEGLKWAHLDIAGTAWISGKSKGATGRPVPLLTQYLLNKCTA